MKGRVRMALGCNHSRCCVFTGFFPWWHRDCAAAKLGLRVLHSGDGVVAPASNERAAPVQGARHVGGAATEAAVRAPRRACLRAVRTVPTPRSVSE